MTSAMGTSTNRPRHTIAVGESLPAMSFTRVGASGTVSWSQGPMASVVFVPHPDRCRECAEYVARLGAAAEGLRDWATRPMVVVGGGDATETVLDPAAAPPGVLVLADRDGAGRSRLGIGDDEAVVVQADRWGAVYAVETVGRAGDHEAVLPTPDDLVGLAKFIDIQCPECGIPSKEWLGSSPFPLG
jgi:hypothetical protein